MAKRRNRRALDSKQLQTGSLRAEAGRAAAVSAAGDGEPSVDFVARERLQAIRARSLKRQAGSALQKTAGLFSDGELGPANIADSNNIGYYSFEFPVDSLEMPQSRPEEMHFYRLAVDRDPIVGRAIDLHTELPLSKMQLEKPKCSSEEFADYVFDFYQRLVNDTKMFATIIEATREHFTLGESFLYVIQPEEFKDMKLSGEAREAIRRGRGWTAGTAPMSEAENGNVVGQEKRILDGWIESRRKKSSLMKKASEEKLFDTFLDAGIPWDEDEPVAQVKKDLKAARARIASLNRPGWLKRADEPAAAASAGPEPGTATAVPDAGPGAASGAGPDAGAEAMDGGLDPGADGGLDGGLGSGFDPGGPPGGGGGGFGGGFDDAAGSIDGETHALAEAATAERDEEINKMKRYIHLLERKKDLLEELEELVEEKRKNKEIFSHITNADYEGFERIQMLAPEKIELGPDPEMGPNPQIFYKPTEDEKVALANTEGLDPKVKTMLESDGRMPLNQNPFQGPFVIHFARKKAGYELHGRSILQRCLRTIIYREKLRQVQTTLASRNMTPKTVITAPGVSVAQIEELRAQADEAKADPDFTIVVNYELNWNEISSTGRLLSLSEEYQHLNSDLAIGLGFSPEILIGEGMYSGNRIALELLNTTYTQFRESLTDILENQIFKPLAMMKGFFELDAYGRPRWIYPKVTFSRLALRDSSDLFDVLFNLYSKGSLPISSLLDFLGYDPETVKRELESDLFSVNDSRFNDLLNNIYGAAAQSIVEQTDVVKRISKGLQLQDVQEDQGAMEGSGEGM